MGGIGVGIIKQELIEVSPYDACPYCEEYRKKGNLHICKIMCCKSEDIYELWQDCPFLDKKYLVRVYEIDGEMEDFERFFK